MQTKLTDLLGCKHPIIQTAMGWVSNSELTAATCNAGGFGFLAGATIPPNEMSKAIRKTRQLTNNAFGINFHMYQPNAGHIVKLAIEYGVKAVSYSRSPEPKYIEELKQANILCIPTIGLPKHAEKAIELGADGVTVQGSEGGGHTGKIPTSLLIPSIVATVKGRVPVVAAGGFKDGRGLLAALSWGADGIAMGIRFLMTQESPVPEATKHQYLNCKNPADIIVSTAMDGLPQRMIVNQMLENLERASGISKLFIALKNGLKYSRFTGAGIFSLLKIALLQSKNHALTPAQTIMAANAPFIIQKAMVDGNPQDGVLPSGQVAAVIDELLTCQEVITSIIDEAEQALVNLVSHLNPNAQALPTVNIDYSGTGKAVDNSTLN